MKADLHTCPDCCCCPLLEHATHGRHSFLQVTCDTVQGRTQHEEAHGCDVHTPARRLFLHSVTTVSEQHTWVRIPDLPIIHCLWLALTHQARVQTCTGEQSSSFTPLCWHHRGKHFLAVLLCEVVTATQSANVLQMHGILEQRYDNSSLRAVQLESLLDSS